MSMSTNSRVSFLLTTNDEPTKSDILHIHKDIENIEARLSTTSDAIALANDALAQAEAAVVRAHAVVNSLKLREQEEMDLLSQYHCTLAPIRRVPRDILIEIFLFTRDWHYNKDPFLGRYHPVGPHPGYRPLSITHVCSEWRKVALSVPMFWSTIKTTYRYAMMGTDPDTTRLLTWLERTGTTSPLDIEFEGPSDFRMSKEPQPRRMTLDWMLPYMSRIRHLALSGRLCGLPSGNFDSLETLRIGTVALRRSSTNDNIRTAPMLRRVAFWRRFIHVPFISWPVLTHLAIQSGTKYPIRRSILLNVLSQCTALVDLVAWCIIKDDDGSDEEDNSSDGEDKVEIDAVRRVGPSEPMLMRFLTSLVIHIGSETAWLLEHLTLPALSKFSIFDAIDGWLKSVYQSFMSRSSPPLETLELNGWLMSERAFFRLLKDTPSVVDIIVKSSNRMSASLVTALIWHGQDGPSMICPKLERFSIEDSQCPHSSADWEEETKAILRMITSRNPGGGPALAVPTTVEIYRARQPKRSSWKEDIQEIENEAGDHVSLHIFF